MVRRHVSWLAAVVKLNTPVAARSFDCAATAAMLRSPDAEHSLAGCRWGMWLLNNDSLQHLGINALVAEMRLIGPLDLPLVTVLLHKHALIIAWTCLVVHTDTYSKLWNMKVPCCQVRAVGAKFVRRL